MTPDTESTEGETVNDQELTVLAASLDQGWKNAEAVRGELLMLGMGAVAFDQPAVRELSQKACALVAHEVRYRQELRRREQEADAGGEVDRGQ